MKRLQTSREMEKVGRKTRATSKGDQGKEGGRGKFELKFRPIERLRQEAGSVFYFLRALKVHRRMDGRIDLTTM